MTNGPPGVQKE